MLQYRLGVFFSGARSHLSPMKIDAGNLWHLHRSEILYYPHSAAILLDDAFRGFSMTSEIRAGALDLGYKIR